MRVKCICDFARWWRAHNLRELFSFNCPSCLHWSAMFCALFSHWSLSRPLPKDLCSPLSDDNILRPKKKTLVNSRSDWTVVNAMQSINQSFALSLRIISSRDLYTVDIFPRKATICVSCTHEMITTWSNIKCQGQVFDCLAMDCTLMYDLANYDMRSHLSLSLFLARSLSHTHTVVTSNWYQQTRKHHLRCFTSLALEWHKDLIWFSTVHPWPSFRFRCRCLSFYQFLHMFIEEWRYVHFMK